MSLDLEKKRRSISDEPAATKTTPTQSAPTEGAPAATAAPAKAKERFMTPKTLAPTSAPASKPAAEHRRPQAYPIPIPLNSTLLNDKIDLRPDFAEPRRRDTATTISPTLADMIDDMQHAWEREHREQIRAAGLAVGSSTFREMLLRIGLKHLEEEADAIGMLPLDQRRRGGTGTARR